MGVLIICRISFTNSRRSGIIVIDNQEACVRLNADRLLYAGVKVHSHQMRHRTAPRDTAMQCNAYTATHPVGMRRGAVARRSCTAPHDTATHRIWYGERALRP